MSKWSEARDAQMVAEGWVKRPDGYWEHKTKPPLWQEIVEIGKKAYGKSKRIKQDSKPLLNKLETEFYEVLKRRYHAEWISPQAIRVKLGNGIWYKCDFFVFVGMPQAYEVKGPKSFRGGFENLKVAAGLYPAIKWHLVWKVDGQWQEQHVLP